MQQVVKRIIQWREIVRGKLLNETRIGKEYEVPGIGRVLVTSGDFSDAREAGDNPLCRLACYREDKNAPQWTVLGFSNFRWLDSCRR